MIKCLPVQTCQNKKPTISMGRTHIFTQLYQYLNTIVHQDKQKQKQKAVTEAFFRFYRITLCEMFTNNHVTPFCLLNAFIFMSTHHIQYIQYTYLTKSNALW